MKQFPYWEPKILEESVNLTVILLSLLGACELIHISVYWGGGGTAVIML
jgi:hypothetical protein